MPQRGNNGHENAFGSVKRNKKIKLTSSINVIVLTKKAPEICASVFQLIKIRGM